MMAAIQKGIGTTNRRKAKVTRTILCQPARHVKSVWAAWNGLSSTALILAPRVRPPPLPEDRPRWVDNPSPAGEVMGGHSLQVVGSQAPPGYKSFGGGWGCVRRSFAESATLGRYSVWKQAFHWTYGRDAKKRRRFNADVIIFRFFCFHIPRRACYEACKPEGSPVIIPPYPPHRITIPECNPCPLLPTGALPFYFRHTSRFGQPYFTDISALLQPYFHRWKYVRTYG